MTGQPSLDRFSWRGPFERPIGGIKSLFEMATCHVCGNEAHPKFLREWNGVDACHYCIEEHHKEHEQLDINSLHYFTLS